LDEQFPPNDLLASRAASLGVHLSDADLNRLSILRDELLDWTTRVNLTSIIDPYEFTIRHLLDSLTIVPIVRQIMPLGGALVDIGAGGGFPGLPIAVVQPELSLLLVEATGKKVVFLQHAIEAMELGNATAIHATAEELGRSAEHRARFDGATARAVGSIATLVELLVPLVRVGGAALLMKKASAVSQEISAAAPALAALDATVENVHNIVDIDLLPDRAVVVIRKLGDTSDRFPRRPGIARKRPLALRTC
jgi:16S rRNA (guanine527-N7)-methyltransferase